MEEIAAPALDQAVAYELPQMRLIDMALLVVDGTENENEEVRRFYEENVAALLVDATKEKIDAYAGIITGMMIEAAMCEARAQQIEVREIERLRRRAARFSVEADKRRIMALQAMAILKTKRLDGHTSTLKAVALAPSIDEKGYDESLVPTEFKDVTFTVKAPVPEMYQFEVWGPPDEDDERELHGYTFDVDIVKKSFTVDKRKLLAALKEKCPLCAGAAVVNQIDPEDGTAICPKCNGKGTILIPGASLWSGKQKLEVE